MYRFLRQAVFRWKNPYRKPLGKSKSLERNRKMSTAISVIGLLAAAVIFVIAIWKGLDVFTSTILVSLSLF